MANDGRAHSPEQALIIAQYPELKSFDEKVTTHFEVTKEIISGIRTIRKDKNISFKEEIALSVLNHEQLTTDFDSVIIKMGNISTLNYVT